MAETPGGDAFPRVELIDLPEGQVPPELTVLVVDRAGAVVHRSGVSADGGFELPKKVLSKASEVRVAPAGIDPAELSLDQVARFHAEDARELIAAGRALPLPASRWGGFFLKRRCVDGKVVHCRPFPWVLESVARRAALPSIQAFRRGDEPAVAHDARSLAAESDALIAARHLPIELGPFCRPVCHGLVEVYSRRCCCEPWVVHDPRLDELIRRLRELLLRRPRLPWPPGPGPLDTGELLRGGVLDDALVNAEADLRALDTLDAHDVAEFVAARPHLRPYWCDCGEATHVATTAIQPGGAFSVCWREAPDVQLPWCHHEYAFVVKQFVGGALVTIYDGVLAGRWFSTTTGIRLASWDARAIPCRPAGPAGDAVVALLSIGGAASHRLKSPAQTSWNSVAVPDYNDGLLDPAPSLQAAKHELLDRNWGGTLALHCYFSDGMKALGAKYFRVGVRRAGPGGNPVGAVHYLSASLAWEAFITTPPHRTLTVPFNVQTVNGQTNLFEIPYPRPDGSWIAGNHGLIDTTQLGADATESAVESEGRHLVTVEVFDAQGHRLRPLGAPDTGGTDGPSTEAAFTFERIVGPNDLTVDVPFAALTHMLWWDNRSAYADIVEVLKDGASLPGDCQFLVGADGAQLSVRYRAGHPNPMFLHSHQLWWRRGINGATGVLVDSPDDAGAPAPGPTATSPSDSFWDMLTKVGGPGPASGRGDETKCSFALNLAVGVKTTNGSAPLLELNAYDQAAFALERTGP